MSQKDIHLDSECARRLGEFLVRRRVEQGYRSARKLGLESGLDYRTITSLEGARRDTVTRSTLAILEMNLHLPAGYLTDIASGGSASRQTVTIDVDTDAAPEAVEQARMVAQAAFNATIQQLKAKGPSV